MDYNKLVSITGLSGLYELLSSKADGGVVRSLEDKSTKFVSTRIHSFSHLESIEIFTTKDNVNLVEVLTAMKDSKTKVPDAKADNKALKTYFEKVYPDMDFERVYASDMKKMVKWLEILTAHKIDIKLTEAPKEEAATEAAAEAKAPKEKAPAKTAAAKPATAKSTTVKKAAPPKKINSPRKMA
ncbi:MAG TPA: DUF5606 domain-containing protein [Ferruginibacter sp.]|jgi:hypothetical protein|nr:DUF5606 domain-containing protein [Ferruginibacter sp.]